MQLGFRTMIGPSHFSQSFFECTEKSHSCWNLIPAVIQLAVQSLTVWAVPNKQTDQNMKCQCLRINIKDGSAARSWKLTASTFWQQLYFSTPHWIVPSYCNEQNKFLIMSSSAGTDQDRAPSILSIDGLFDPCIKYLRLWWIMEVILAKEMYYSVPQHIGY
jgi:hypothetical protein